MMTIKKKRLIITIIVTVIIITIGIITLIILSQNMNLFKSKDTIIKDNIGQVFDRFANIIDFDYEKQIYNSLEEKTYESNSEIILNNEKKGSKLKLISDSQVDNKENYKYNYTKLSYGEENIAEVEYLKQDNVIGIRLKDLIKQYISVKNEDLDKIVQEIDSFDKEKYGMSKTIDKIDISQEIKISEKEKEILKEKYIEIILNNLSNKEITTQKDSIVTVQEQKYKANAYTVIINKNELNNIYIEILENLKTDKIILNKISNVENLYKKYVLNQDELIKNYYINYIDELINYVKNNQQEYEIRFTIYEVNKSVIKVSIEHELRKINLEINNPNETIINDMIMGETENTKQIIITKNNGQLKVFVTTLIGEDKTELDIEGKIVNDDKNIKTEMSIIYTKDEKKALYINNNIKIVDKIEEKHDEKENNIILNDLEKKNLNKIVKRVTEIVKSKLPDKLKILQKGLDINITDNMIISEDGKTEGQKNKFNAKFEFYAGDNISKENVMTLLDVIKLNLENIEINNVETDNAEQKKETTNKDSKEEKGLLKDIKFKIKEDSKYEGDFKEVEKIIEESNKFRVKIEYNKDTDIIEYITITNKNEK